MVPAVMTNDGELCRPAAAALFRRALPDQPSS